MTYNVKAFIMWLDHINSSFIYLLGTENHSQTFLTSLILYKLTVDLISATKGTADPAWRVHSAVLHELRASCKWPREEFSSPLWGIGVGFSICCLAFNSAQYLSSLSLPHCLSFFRTSFFFFHVTHSSIQHYFLPPLSLKGFDKIRSRISMSLLPLHISLVDLSLSVETRQMKNRWLLILIEIHTPSSISFESVEIFHSTLTSVMRVTSVTLWRVI